MNKFNPVAVVGMSCIFPDAVNINAFWSNLENGRSAVKEIPASRWLAKPESVMSEKYEIDRTCSRRAGLIDGFGFDPEGFEVAPEILSKLDPSHKIVLDAGRQLLNDFRLKENEKPETGIILAAIALPTEGSSRLTGKLVWPEIKSGITGNEVSEAGLTLNQPDKHDCLAAKVTGFPASITARALGLGGYTLTLDAACASSLYAIKLACDELSSGRAKVMIAGGVSRPDCLYTQIGFTQLQAISPTGICRPFDADADGLVVGEGAGLVMLKRLDDAINDGDTVFGVIRGIGLSNDIGGNLLAPEPAGQLRAMKSAYISAGWTPHDVDFIECHGAGTPVGDKIELSSLTDMMAGRDKKNPCRLGAVKSTTGHLLTAAGAAGFIKTVLSIYNKTFVPTCNHRKHSSDSPLEKGLVKVQTLTEKWEKNGETRKAAVSAFGFGGINGHILVEGFPGTNSEKPVVTMPEKAAEIAIVGIGIKAGKIKDADDFRDYVLKGIPATEKILPERFRNISGFSSKGVTGNPLYEVSTYPGEFHIPPNEIPEILPQHILMLQAAKEAMISAGLSERKERPEMGGAVGIEFDYEATNYHLRWDLENRLKEWGVELENEKELEDLKNHLSPPLNANRTIGSLGSIIASRVAKEFRLGGPCFSVSCESESGMKAVEIGLRSLRNHETDVFLAGAVDFTSDVRSVLIRNRLLEDRQETSDCAAAVIMKRLDDAVKDGDTVYAVIKSVDSSASESVAMRRSLKDAGISGDDISYIESACQDEFLLPGISDSNRNSDIHTALGSAAGITGFSGAASGLVSIIKTALCLYNDVLPPVSGTMKRNHAPNGRFHIPSAPSFWFRNLGDKRRHAAVLCHTPGNQGCVAILSDYSGKKEIFQSFRPNHGFFAVSASSENLLLERLDDFERFISEHNEKIQDVAENWSSATGEISKKSFTIAFVSSGREKLAMLIAQARRAVKEMKTLVISGPESVFYYPEKPDGKVCFVYPGSGAHYAGMGRETGAAWPFVLQKLDRENDGIKNWFSPEFFIPYRSDWENGWEDDAAKKTASDMERMIAGQVIHGYAMTRLLNGFGIKPEAVIGYSLGESAANFSTGVWRDPGEMFARMKASPLFKTELAGKCLSTRKAWNIPEDDDFEWAVALVNRSSEETLREIEKHPLARLLLVNTAAQCVIGGHKPQIESVIASLGTEAGFMDGVVAVHCDAASLSAEAYRNMHVFDVSPDPEIVYYSCYFGKNHEITTDSAADSIIGQTLHGFDYTRVINQAYNDGVRYFIEAGPGASCTRMIGQILSDRPHVAAAACVKGEDGTLTFLKLAARLASLGIFTDIEKLFTLKSEKNQVMKKAGSKSIIIPTSGNEFSYAGILKKYFTGNTRRSGLTESIENPDKKTGYETADKTGSPVKNIDNNADKNIENRSAPENFRQVPEHETSHSHTMNYGESLYPDENASPIAEIVAMIAENSRAAAEAHSGYLDFSMRLQKNMADAISLRADLIAFSGASYPDSSYNAIRPCSPPNVFWTPDSSEDGISSRPDSAGAALTVAPARKKLAVNENVAEPYSGAVKSVSASEGNIPDNRNSQKTLPAYDRDMCMEFATGSAEKVLGHEFAPLDTYKVRVRLPDEPLMLVDRIVLVEGEKNSMKGGRCVTEHDVLPGAWYLDGGRAPACISIEAGQADLFLCSYLGIDLRVKGTRSYRLLDANAQFHRPFPQPGDTVRYDIRIEKFIRQGETWMFFFNYDGYIGEELMITMKNGCAGFFTPEEVKNSGGIVLTPEELQPVPGKLSPDYRKLVPMKMECLDENQVEALRTGNLEAAFGPDFRGRFLSKSLSLPSGKMKLIDRVTEIDPEGGRYGLGRIHAEADINPDAWFLACHFVDDMVMPGTLMYECCCHALRILTLRMGWITEKEDTFYGPVTDVGSVLKCRGPVTTETKKVLYEIDIKEIGYDPEPFVIADALMYADGRRIVSFRSMTMKIYGVTRDEIEKTWNVKNIQPEARPDDNPENKPDDRTKVNPVAKFDVFTNEQILECCMGEPSRSFGEKYRPWDSDMNPKRFIARLPKPPYLCMDRVVEADVTQWDLKPAGWITAEFDIRSDAWYFRANRSKTMPFSFLLEAALQPCGWLAAYMGSALHGKEDLRFRNLGGKAIQYREVIASDSRLTMRSRLTRASKAGGMIIENFDMEVLEDGEMVYSGATSFGFFTKAALAAQAGITGETVWMPEESDLKGKPLENLPVFSPLFPEDAKSSSFSGMALPSKAMRMFDRGLYVPGCGPENLGIITGEKDVDPEEWFFRAHFHEDPVCPGSLGLESFIQLLKLAALRIWPELSGRARFSDLLDDEHSWTYRGQILGHCRLVKIHGYITKIEKEPVPVIKANGYLFVDDLCIYKMENFGIRLIME